MIEDLDGATAEPTRRRHVLAASLATAAGAVALFAALVLTPLEIDELPRTTISGPSASAAPPRTIVSRPSILTSIELIRQGACDGQPGIRRIPIQSQRANTRTSWPVTIGFVVDPSTGQRLPIMVTVDERTLWTTVTCDASDSPAPRIDRAR